MKNKFKILFLFLTTLVLGLSTFNSVNINNKVEGVGAIESSHPVKYRKIKSINEMTWDKDDEYYFITADLTTNRYSVVFNVNKWGATSPIGGYQGEDTISERGFSIFHIVKVENEDKYLIYDIINGSNVYLCSDMTNNVVWASNDIDDARHWSLEVYGDFISFYYMNDDKCYLSFADTTDSTSPPLRWSGLWALNAYATWDEWNASRLYIFKKVKNYTVSFDANGGSGSSEVVCEGFRSITFPNNLTKMDIPLTVSIQKQMELELIIMEVLLIRSMVI